MTIKNLLELGGHSDPPDIPEGHHDGWGHCHISLAWPAMVWLALEWAGFQSHALNKAVLGSPEKS